MAINYYSTIQCLSGLFHELYINSARFLPSDYATLSAIASSGYATISQITTSGYLKATDRMYPVDARAVSGNIIPDNSGYWNLGSSTKFFHQLWANSGIYQSGVSVSGFDVVAKVNEITGPNFTIKGGWGLSGLVKGNDGDSVNSHNLFVMTSGFMLESGVGYGRRFIYPHDGMGVANQTYKSNGVYTISASGTASNPNDDKRMCTHYTTGGTSTAPCTIGAIVSQNLRPQDNISFRADFRIMISGANPTTFWCGLMNMNPNNSGLESIVGDTRFQCAALFYKLGLPNWYFVTKANAGAASSGAISTGILPIPDTSWHDVHIFTPDAGTNWYIEIDRGGITGFSSNVPTSGSAMGPIVQIVGNTVGFRNSYLSTRVNAPGPMPFDD